MPYLAYPLGVLNYCCCLFLKSEDIFRVLLGALRKGFVWMLMMGGKIWKIEGSGNTFIRRKT